MKTLHFRVATIAIVASLYLCITACIKSADSTPSNGGTASCPSVASTESTTVNGFDYNPSSPFYNRTIVNFRFDQALTSYPNNCAVSSYGATDLKITNVITKTVSFSYLVTFSRGVVTWQYQNAVTIAPGATVDVGVISTKPTEVNGGAISIQSNGISYL